MAAASAQGSGSSAAAATGEPQRRCHLRFVSLLVAAFPTRCAPLLAAVSSSHGGRCTSRGSQRVKPR
eukprot:5343963-Prorocentrum_lima.AAC.1